MSGGGGHHDGVVPLVDAVLTASCLGHTVLHAQVVGAEDDVVAGDARDRPGGGEHYQGAVKTLLHDDPPGHGEQCDVPAPRHVDSVMDMACEDDGSGALVDEDGVQPGGEVDVEKPGMIQGQHST